MPIGHPSGKRHGTAARWACALLLCLLVQLAAAHVALGAPQHPYNLGCKALAAGDVAKATALFAQAVKLDPANTDALNNLAVCYMKSGDYAKALPVLQKVLKLNSRYSGADLNTGANYLFQGDAAKAEEPTIKAQDAPPTAVGKSVQAAAFYNLGLIAAEAGDYAAAQADFEKSAAISASATTDIALGCALSAQGKYDEGIAALKKAQVSDPELVKIVKSNLAAAYYQQGMTKLENGDVNAAEQAFTASNTQAKNDYAAMGLALVDAERGNHDAAVAALTDLKKTATESQLKKALAVNLARVAGMSGTETEGWLGWLVLIGGGLLFAVQTWAVMRTAAVRRRGTLTQPMVAVGALAGVVTAAVFALAYLDVYRSTMVVLAVLAVDIVVVALTLWAPTAARRQMRAA